MLPFEIRVENMGRLGTLRPRGTDAGNSEQATWVCHAVKQASFYFRKGNGGQASEAPQGSNKAAFSLI